MSDQSVNYIFSAMFHALSGFTEPDEEGLKNIARSMSLKKRRHANILLHQLIRGGAKPLKPYLLDETPGRTFLIGIDHPKKASRIEHEKLEYLLSLRGLRIDPLFHYNGGWVITGPEENVEALKKDEEFARLWLENLRFHEEEKE